MRKYDRVSPPVSLWLQRCEILAVCITSILIKKAKKLKTKKSKMSLTDDEVQNQIRVMVSFIDQEAKEKAEEIDTKAEEEFQIEKGKIVESQRQKISEHYAKKEKQLNQQKLVKHSHMLNRNRLQAVGEIFLLSALRDVFDIFWRLREIFFKPLFFL